MTIIAPGSRLVRTALKKNGVECLTELEAGHQDVRPLRIGILNIMPEAGNYEFNLLFPLGRSILQIQPVWLRLRSKPVSKSGIRWSPRYCVPYDDACKAGLLDGLILTGAPVERLPYSEIRYWDELQDILKHARKSICSTLGICWGGMALAKVIGIEKTVHPKKIFGMFKTHNLVPGHPFTGGMDDVFWCPQSRYASIMDEDLEKAKRARKVRLLAQSESGGYTIFETPDHRFVMHLGHHEYNAGRLVKEYKRDSERGLTDVCPPENFDVAHPMNQWRANRNEFFSAWIRYLYLNTKYSG